MAIEIKVTAGDHKIYVVDKKEFPEDIEGKRKMIRLAIIEALEEVEKIVWQ